MTNLRDDHTTGKTPLARRKLVAVLGVLAAAAGMLIPTAAAEASPPFTVAAAGPAPGGKHPAPEGKFGMRLTEVTESLHTDPRAREYIIDHLNPGTVLRRRVEVYNDGATPLHLTLYPAAASVGDSAFHFADGHQRNELTTWTSVDPDTVDLGPYARKTAVVTIDVPRDASPGEHYGVVWAEATSPPVRGTGLRMVNRVGVRVYLDIGPGGPRAAGFTIAALTARRLEDGRAAVTTEVHNTGGRALDMSGELHLDKGPGGLRAGPFQANLGTTIGPGEVSPVAIALDGQLPVGPWNATVTLRSGLVEHTVTTTIIFPKRSGDSHRYLLGADSTGGIVLLSVIAAAVLVIVALGITMMRRRRRRAAAARPSPAGPDDGDV